MLSENIIQENFNPWTMSVVDTRTAEDPEATLAVPHRKTEWTILILKTQSVIKPSIQ